MPVCCLSIAVCLLLQAGPRVARQTQTAAPRSAVSVGAGVFRNTCLEAANYHVSPSIGDPWAAPQARGADQKLALAQKLQPPSEDQLTFFPHPDNTRYWVSGQANSIYQMHGNFHSPYQGANSFTATFQYKASVVGTLMLGYQINPNPRYETEVIFNVESSGGRGLSQALGLAGFTNLDVVRNPNLGPAPYVARIEIHQTIGFTNEMASQSRGPLALATRVPARRLGDSRG